MKCNINISIDLITISVVLLALAVEAKPQRGPRRGGCGLRGPGGLNGPFEACEDEVSSDDMDCDVDQKARVFPYSSCRDLAVNDELPTKDDMKNKNPCKGAMEGDEVIVIGCYLCAIGTRKDSKVADLTNAVDLTIDTECVEGWRRRDGLIPDPKDGECSSFRTLAKIKY